MPSISVIVPVYNTSKYLDKCLQSLADQSFQDIEIIAINDGSTDSSLSILEKYQKTMKNLVIVNQDNHGISDTRNTGMQMAKGEYLAFLDSDDSIQATMYEELYCKAVSENLDIVVCDFYNVQEKSGEKSEYLLPSFAPTSLKDNPFLLFSINSSPWNKLFKKSIFKEHNIRFPKLKYEDAYVVIMALAKAQRIGKVAGCFVNYLLREGSETTSMNASVFDIFEIIEAIKEELEKEDSYEVYSETLEYFVINRLSVYNLQQIYQKERTLGVQFINHSFSYLDSIYPKWRKNRYFKKENSHLKYILKSQRWLTRLYVSIASK